MQVAETTSWRSTCERNNVGALIVLDGRPLSVGYNGAPAGLAHCQDIGCLIDSSGGCIRTQHAEANAIAWAARKGIAVEGATLYVTLSPCLPCAKLIINAGIARVVYLSPYRDSTGVDYLRMAGVQVEEFPITDLDVL
ncbi:MAG: deaminase [Chromatiaceae bacterium]|nr:deaminase [Candidatus Thioaporhodococcus sediminis]